MLAGAVVAAVSRITSCGKSLRHEVHGGRLERFLRRALKRSIRKDAGLISFVTVRVERHAPSLLVAEEPKPAEVYRFRW